MPTPQPGILLPPAPAAHYLTGQLRGADHAPALLAALTELAVDEDLVVGLGAPLLAALGRPLPGLRPFPTLHGAVDVPATQDAVWVYARGANPGAALDRASEALAAINASCGLGEDVPCFLYREGRDLTGYVDGTENPAAEAAIEAAFVLDGPLAGSSFAAGQRWVHDLAAFGRMPRRTRDETIGRDLDSNEELADAPATAHVKRAAQESYDPAAFMVRRSMPYGSLAEHGLYFVAFGADLDRYERVLRRMAGLEDGLADALFRFSRPVSGGYYWCPPVAAGRLDLGALRG